MNLANCSGNLATKKSRPLLPTEGGFRTGPPPHDGKAAAGPCGAEWRDLGRTGRAPGRRHPGGLQPRRHAALAHSLGRGLLRRGYRGRAAPQSPPGPTAGAAAEIATEVVLS